MKNVIRGLGASMAVLSVVGVASMGTAAAAPAYYMGPASYNQMASYSMRFDGVHKMHRHFMVPRFVTNINNRNEVNVSNNVSQFAQSGSASVSGNRFGGNATSGSASNSSSISTTVNINNN